MERFLLYRDNAGAHRSFDLPDDRGRLTIGRRSSNDLALPWDVQVSRTHAELVRMGTDWVVCDDGISHNGTFVNGERVRGRRRLRDGDQIALGDTVIAFCASSGPSITATTPALERPPELKLTAAQRRVLTALCRPLHATRYAAPASNQQIADELVISVATVKGTLTTLFELFALDDLPQNAKRAALATRGLVLLDQP
jgi:pSer/pThr/pTyr-binding forkhead associated (FHA) protein